jgi:hypothetical protein
LADARYKLPPARCGFAWERMHKKRAGIGQVNSCPAVFFAL